MGADYFKWQHKNRVQSGGLLSKTGLKGRGRDDLIELSRAVEEHEARLNAVAMVFLKRSFLHIRLGHNVEQHSKYYYLLKNYYYY